LVVKALAFSCGYWLVVVGYWLVVKALAFSCGYWLVVVGYWLGVKALAFSCGCWLVVKALAFSSVVDYSLHPTPAKTWFLSWY